MLLLKVGSTPSTQRYQLTAAQFLTTFLLACPTVANPLPDAPAPPLTKRWNSLSCHTNNYKHTASWGWTTGMEGSINLGCGALFGYSGHPRWVAKGGTLVISVPLPTKGYATHIQVSFVARHRGTWIDSKLCKSMLGEVLWRCTIRKKHQDAVGKIHGMYL